MAINIQKQGLCREFFRDYCKNFCDTCCVFTLAGFGTYLDRKLLGLMQKRLGPTYVGPWGLLQIVADGIKLFIKEDIIPQNANKIIFILAPIVSVSSAFIVMTPVPFCQNLPYLARLLGLL